jgi:hypothetical protein
MVGPQYTSVITRSAALGGLWCVSFSPITGALRAVTPAPIRRRLRVKHQEHVFRRAIIEFARNPEKSIDAQSDVLLDLIYGWDNGGWVASPEYLSACLNEALAAKAAILECGSGLTTILVGMIAARRGQPLWTLEHDRQWGMRVRRRLVELQIESVRLCVRPLKDYFDFSWYDPPLQAMPDFSLIICDGPPGQTVGGRSGLLPVMKEKIRRGGVILLDDAVREHERSVAARCAQELGVNYQIVGSERPFIRFTLPH